MLSTVKSKSNLPEKRICSSQRSQAPQVRFPRPGHTSRPRRSPRISASTPDLRLQLTLVQNNEGVPKGTMEQHWDRGLSGSVEGLTIFKRDETLIRDFELKRIQEHGGVVQHGHIRHIYGAHCRKLL